MLHWPTFAFHFKELHRDANELLGTSRLLFGRHRSIATVICACLIFPCNCDCHQTSPGVTLHYCAGYDRVLLSQTRTPSSSEWLSLLYATTVTVRRPSRTSCATAPALTSNVSIFGAHSANWTVDTLQGQRFSVLGLVHHQPRKARALSSLLLKPTDLKSRL